MKIKDYTEKEIKNKILSKIKPKLNKNPKHWRGDIYIGDKWVAKVKIPNDHNRIMHQSKSQYIASDLRLNAQEFNNLIECPLKGPEYYQKLKKIV